MIRVLVYFVVVALLAMGAAWFADRPGNVVINWQGLRIETSVLVLIAAALLLALATTALWTLVRALMRSPDLLWRYLRARRGVRGYLTLSQGLIAVGSGDARMARRLADEASRVAAD